MFSLRVMALARIAVGGMTVTGVHAAVTRIPGCVSEISLSCHFTREFCGRLRRTFPGSCYHAWDSRVVLLPLNIASTVARNLSASEHRRPLHNIGLCTVAQESGKF